MKLRIAIISLSILFLTGCNLGTPPAAVTTNIPTATEAAVTTPQPASENIFAFDPFGISVGFNYPAGFTQGVIDQFMPVYVPNAPYDIAYPQHASIVFTGYSGDTATISSTGIRIFLTSEVNAIAPDDVSKLNAVLAGQLDQRTDFPHLAGAGRLIDAQAVLLPFQSGNGYRFLALSKFDASALSGTSMTYLYQGLSQDGQYMVSFVTSVDAPFISDLATGQAFNSEDEATTYKSQLNDRLNTADPNQFNPPLTTLDALVSSIVIIKK